MTPLCTPAVPPDGWPCPPAPVPQFQGAVEGAIYKLTREHPELFRGYYVLDRNGYYNGVFKNLYEAGYCAMMDSHEMAVSERGNRFYRENFNILASSGNYRSGPYIHQSACQVPR